MIEKLKVHLRENPLVWMLGAALVVALHGGYQNGRRLTEVCGLVADPMEWSSVKSANLHNTVEELNRLETEESLAGDVWRWQKTNGRQIEEICAEREADQHDERELGLF